MTCYTQTKKCCFHYAIETEERLVEQLIMGDWQVKVQKKLLSLNEAFTVGVAKDTAITHEATLTDLQQFTRETTIRHISQPKKLWQPRDNQPIFDKCGRHHMSGRYIQPMAARATYVVR